MGILRNREELLPVTCAVLKDDEREQFFSSVRRKAGGNMDRVAKTVGAQVGTLQDWVNGTANIPYITLQRLASEFEVEMPSVTELRREYQQVAPPPPPKRSARAHMPSTSGPVGGAGSRRPARPMHAAPKAPDGPDFLPLRSEPKPRKERPARPPRGEGRKPRQEKPRRERQDAKRAPRPPKAAAAHHAPGPRVPKLSDEAAYWAGAALAGARRDGDALVLASDARVGQGYAAVWAELTFTLFGVKPVLAMGEDQQVQEARLPVAGLEDFIGRLDLKPGAPRPPAPRWAWSNPDWKKAFLKGLVDATAGFSEGPALQLPAMDEPLRRSTEKLFASVGLTAQAGEGGALRLEGAEALGKYAASVGSDNPKLRDHLKAFYRAPEKPAGTPEQASTAGPAPAGAAGPKGRGRRRRRGGRGGRRGEAQPAGAAPAPEGTTVSEVSEHGTEPADAAGPEAPAEPARELPVDERLPEV